MESPAVNFTIPTFNRLELTKRCIFSLKRHVHVPSRITVVDNCSTDGTREFLVKLHEHGVIDHLCLLRKNMGVSCASNFGFDVCPTPLYMKLDNDIEVTDPRWILDILDLWSADPEVAFLGPRLGAPKAALYDVTLGSGRTVTATRRSLTGSATAIARDVFNILGYWNEDYGLYGEEDADYSHRAKLARFLLVCYASEGRIRDLGTPPSTQADYNSYKSAQRRKNLVPRTGINKFALYCYLYEHGILELHCPRRYLPAINGYDVKFSINPHFMLRKKVVTACARAIGALPDAMFASALGSEDFVAALTATAAEVRLHHQPPAPPATGQP
ncbi:glycosyltransferase [Nitratidesulfovibrio sp.]|uniref:glycosyltransferase n=1 Tax=Nitratidesulfovibrio sp. TaxID=2802297 RepID=UPI00333F0E66